MIQFLGNIEAKADAKGRVFIPATFRKQLQTASEEKLVLRKDVYQDCLVLYPESVWFATQNQLRCRLNKWNAKPLHWRGQHNRNLGQGTCRTTIHEP